MIYWLERIKFALAVDYDVYRNWHDYIDGAYGMFAYVYHIDNEAELHGVGKF